MSTFSYSGAFNALFKSNTFVLIYYFYILILILLLIWNYLNISSNSADEKLNKDSDLSGRGHIEVSFGNSFIIINCF